MVVVDEAIWPYGRMMMCHMMAHDLSELHVMAQRLRLRREWFQDKPGGTPHYDVCKAIRAKAIEFGAVPIDRKGTVEMIYYWRAKKALERLVLERKLSDDASAIFGSSTSYPETARPTQ
jgi:hypothetical protein